MQFSQLVKCYHGDSSAQCLKITQNVSFVFINFGLLDQFDLAFLINFRPLKM